MPQFSVTCRPAAAARRSLLAAALLGLAAAGVPAPAAAQLHPFHSYTYTEGNLLGFGPGEDDRFGAALASGDFNGDGADDLVTGVPNDDNLNANPQQQQSGIAIVRYGVLGAGLKRGIATTVLSQAWGGSPRPAEPWDHMGNAFAVGDFDADGFDDVAVGIVGDHDTSYDIVGGVQVYYGAATGVQLAGAQFFNQWSDGFPGGSDGDVTFGYALAAGDFDGDGFADLAIGQPRYNADWGWDFNYGRVMVIYGSSAGLDTDHTQTWSQDHPGMDGSEEDDDLFGAALAAGDFNGDGPDDLAIGVPGENDGGGVHFMFGSVAGLTAAGNNLWTQDDDGVAEDDELEDTLGAALAVGDFNQDGFDDVAVGAPGESVDLGGDVVAGFGGVVHIFPGAADGPAGPTSTMWTASSTGLLASELNDRWGNAFAVGDFDRDGFPDLAIGAYCESLGTTARAGEVTILRGSAGGITSFRGQVFNQGTLGVPDVNETDDRFGWALAAGDFDGNGHADLVVGAALESTVFLSDGAETVLNGFVFADDFETAGTARWQLTQRSLLRDTNGIGAQAAAKLGPAPSSYGLNVSLLDAASNAVYVMAGPNQGFAANTTLRGTFYVDVKNLTMSPTPGVNVFRLMSLDDGTAAGSKPRLTIDLNRNDSVGGWALLVNSWNDNAAPGGSLQFAAGAGFSSVADANGHVRIDFDWRAGNPGQLTMWKTRYVGGVPDAAGKQQMFSVALPGAQTAVVNALYVGMLSGKDPGTFGALYLDEISLSR